MTEKKKPILKEEKQWFLLLLTACALAALFFIASFTIGACVTELNRKFAPANKTQELRKK